MLCGDLPGLRDRALLSAGYDTGLRASGSVAIEVEHVIEAIDPDARLLSIPRSKSDQDGEGPPPISVLVGPVGPKLRFWPSRRTFWERGIRY